MRFFALVLLNFAASSVGLVQGTLLVYIMRNENYYNVSKDEIGHVLGDVVFYSQIGIICGGEFLAGFLHDIIGPRLNIFIGLLLVSVGTAGIPFGSSAIPYLIFMRILVMVGIAAMITNPLVIDYVEHSS